LGLIGVYVVQNGALLTNDSLDFSEFDIAIYSVLVHFDLDVRFRTGATIVEICALEDTSSWRSISMGEALRRFSLFGLLDFRTMLHACIYGDSSPAVELQNATESKGD
jgi:hypothetical protein